LKKLSTCLIALVFLLIIASNAGAQTIKLSDTAFLKINGFVQGTLHMPIDQGPSLKKDFYLKRVRLCFSGQAAKNVNYFIGTLNGNMGVNGDMSARTLIADAWVEFVTSEHLKINAGLLKLPFSRHMQQTGAKLHGLEFHGSFLNRAGGIGHRDMGIMARGLLADQHVDYRFAILDGVEYAPGDIDATPPVPPRNKNDCLRFVGRVGYNVFDAEPGFFWAGTYLGAKKILSFGASFDLQPGVGGENGDELYSAFALDAFADIPMGENGIVSTLNIYSFGAGGAVPQGFGFWADFGYRIKNIEPLIAFESYKPKDGDAGKRQAVLGGLNWWIKGHNVSLKFQLGTEKLNGAEDWTKTGDVQVQVFF